MERRSLVPLLFRSCNGADPGTVDAAKGLLSAREMAEIKPQEGYLAGRKFQENVYSVYGNSWGEGGVCRKDTILERSIISYNYPSFSPHPRL